MYKHRNQGVAAHVHCTAVIGGTGLNNLAGLEPVRQHVPATPYGEISAPVQEGRLGGQAVYFLPRHGTPHHLPPHRINYRANLWALRKLGVNRVVAVNAVGGVQKRLLPGMLVLPDQVIDYTWGREHTFFDGSGPPPDESAQTGGPAPLEHIDFTRPYDADLREVLLRVASQLDIACEDGGTYAATQGPRLESAAEIQRLARDGCDVVGMTGMPEAALAAELGLAYATLCLVVNPGAGLAAEPITMEAMGDILAQKTPLIGKMLTRLLAPAKTPRQA